MSAFQSYFQIVQTQLAAIVQSQSPKMEAAAALVARALLNNHFIYIFGSGHSHALAEELFYRAGGLARVVPILDENLMVHKSASDSSQWERKEGYAATVLNRYSLGKEDLLFVVSNSGRNPVPIEMAMEATKRGAKVIAILSAEHSSTFSSRHSSGKKLAEVADLVIDNCSVAGDAALALSNSSERVGPTSTITSASILNAIVVEAIAQMKVAGAKPEIYSSINSDGSSNETLLKKYRGIIPHL